MMIIVISGTPGSGKSSAAREVAKKIGYRHYSTGDFMREMAAKRKISITKFSRMAETDSSIDREIDDWLINLGKKEDNFVIDSRLGAFFIPKSIKIFLDADLKIRGQRILKDARKGEDFKSLKESIRNIKARESSEKKRYKNHYNIDCYDKTKFDKVIDTTYTAIEEVVEKIVSFLKRAK